MLGWPALPAGARRRHKRYAVLGVAAAVVVLLVGGLFLYELLDRPIEGLPEGPSPWFALYREDPASAEREILRDARGVLAVTEQLDRLEEELGVLREAFGRGEKTYLSQLAHDEMNVMLTAYLDLRGMLLRTVWRYRGANADAASESSPRKEASAAGHDVALVAAARPRRQRGPAAHLGAVSVAGSIYSGDKLVARLADATDGVEFEQRGGAPADVRGVTAHALPPEVCEESRGDQE